MFSQLRNLSGFQETKILFDKSIDADLIEESRKLTREAREGASILLHHDAITGTCSQEASDDYQQRINGVYDTLYKMQTNIEKMN
jgi:hypothetical protein